MQLYTVCKTVRHIRHDDAGSEHLFGANAMDLSLRPAAARAGFEQGRARAEQLATFWG